MRCDGLPFFFFLLAAKGRRYLELSLFYHFVESDVSDCRFSRVHVRGEGDAVKLVPSCFTAREVLQ